MLGVFTSFAKRKYQTDSMTVTSTEYNKYESK